jgi:hypothetical protein
MGLEDFEDFIDLRFGPFQMGFSHRPFRVSYSRTEDSHIVRLKLRADISREDIKVRLLEGGVLEIQWPRKTKGEEIPVE